MDHKHRPSSWKPNKTRRCTDLHFLHGLSYHPVGAAHADKDMNKASKLTALLAAAAERLEILASISFRAHSLL